MGFDSTANKAVIAFRDDGNSDYGTAVVGTVSGTSISFGSEAVFQTNQTSSHNLAYDPDENKMVLVYQHGGNSSYGTSNVCTITGTSIAFGTDAIFKTASTETTTVSYDTSANKMVIPYAISGKGNAVVGTVSGTSISFGAEAEFNDGGSSNLACAYDSTGDITVVSYTEAVTTFDGFAVAGTVSGTSISFGPALNFTGDVTYSSNGRNTIYDPDANKFVSAYRGAGSVVYTPSTTNLTSTNFVGIADAGISTSATGTIVVQGGTVSMVADTTYTVTVAGAKFVIDGVSQATLNLYEGSTYTFDQAEGTNATHPLRFSASSDGTHGTITAQTFTTEPSLNWPCAVYDTTNDKIVIAYRYWTGSANVGAVIVGTVSGNSITYGTPSVMAPSAFPTDTTITYDSNANKVVISYRDANNSDYGTSVVATVSGTSTSFGTPVVYSSGNTYPASTFDSSNNKVVIAYKDAADGDAGKGIVGTVSGTSISFGTAVEFASQCDRLNCTFDSSTNTVVVQYRDEANSAYGTANVGTVSGTSISFGADVVFNASGTSMLVSSFDTTANKVVISYQDGGNSDYGTSVVGTVSGTSISFGAESVFASEAVNDSSSSYNVAENKTTIGYKAPTNYGTLVNGTISGTSISFDTPAVFSAAATTYQWSAYDPDAGKVVITYIGLSSYGYSYVYPITEYTTGVTTNGTPGSAGAYTRIVVATGAPTLYYYCSNHSGYGGTANTPSFVTGSKYYVQNDGTITTVSSSVNAGLATSTTQLLLNGDS